MKYLHNIILNMGKIMKRVVIGTLVFLSFISYSSVTFAQSQVAVSLEEEPEISLPNNKISPILECVVAREDNTFLAYFGYENHNTVDINILVGDDNKITGGGLSGFDHGQISDFEYPAPKHPEDRPGRTGFYPHAAFRVLFDGSPLVWSLRGPDGQMRTATASGESTLCPELEDDTENSDDSEDDDIDNNTGGGSSSSSLVRTSVSSFVASPIQGEVLGVSIENHEGEVLGETDISCPVFDGYVRRGNRGQEVRAVQEFLNSHINADLVIDGIFGPLTEQAVRSFQATYWDQIIAPWGSLDRPNTTGRWFITTRAWAHELLGCREDMQTLSNGVEFSTASFVTQ